MTHYVVLYGVTGDEPQYPVWHHIGPDSIKAASASDAIRQVVTTRTTSEASQGGAYVAVPLRSFKPVSVVVESKPSVQIGELA